MANTSAVENRRNHPGKWSAYHAIGVGIGWDSKGKESAVRFRHVGSPLASLTTPEPTISRNSSQRNSHTTTRGGSVRLRGRSSQTHGARNIARKPDSSSSVSHWYDRKS